MSESIILWFAITFDLFDNYRLFDTIHVRIFLKKLTYNQKIFLQKMNEDEEIRLSHWLNSNENLVQFLIPNRLKADADKEMRLKFQSNRNFIHNQLYQILKNYQLKLSKKYDAIVSKLNQFMSSPIQDVKSIYDNQTHNMVLHKFLYANTQYLNLNIQIYSKKLTLINQKSNDIKALIQLYASNNIISKNIFFQMRNAFFEKNDDELLKKLKFKSKAIASYIQRLKHEISHFPNPLWATKSFSDFFSELLNAALSQFDKNILYVLPLEKEVSLSRYIYAKDKRMAEKIEETANLVKRTDVNDEQTMYEIIKTAINLIPNVRQKTYDEQSIGFMFFYRIIFDKIYELNYQAFLNCEMNIENDSSKENNVDNNIHKNILPISGQTKLFKIGKLPIKIFTLPFKYDKSLVHVSIRDFFIQNYFFHESALFLNHACYVTNPIDAIYFVHRSLILIQKAALVSQVTGEATIEDMKKLLCFDDLFTLLEGVLLASDIPNFFQLSKFMQQYIPDQSLSNSFEYAQSAIKALELYLHEFDIDSVYLNNNINASE